MKLAQHLLGPKLGHKSMPKAVKCSTSTVQTDGNSQQISTIQIELVEHVQRLQIRINKLSRLTDNRHSLQAETSQQTTSEDQRENGATTPEQNTTGLCRSHYSPKTIE